MQPKQKPIQIRDARSRRMFRVDDRFIDGGYALACGTAAACVYMSLCRHSDGNQESWPSIQNIAGKFGIHERTVLRAIKKLEEFNIISVKREKNERTKRQMVNVYVLMDESQWSRVTPRQSEPGDISSTEPGDISCIKPGDTTAVEGITEEKVTHRKGVAEATDLVETKPKCGYDACTKDAIRKENGDYLENCKDHQPMNCAEFVAWYRKSPKRYINLIAELADETHPMFNTVIQWEVWAGQHYKPAKQLEAFDDEQIGRAFKEMKRAEYINTFNLFTVLKFLTNGKK